MEIVELFALIFVSVAIFLVSLLFLGYNFKERH